MRRRLLIVDDDADSSNQLRKLLQSDTLSVETVASGHEALTSLANDDYSLLMTDLKMPGMGGLDLIREIAQRRIPVTTIVTTAFGSIDRVVEAMRMGAYDFLTKPIDPSYLKLVMDRALKQRALQDEVLARSARTLKARRTASTTSSAEEPEDVQRSSSWSGTSPARKQHGAHRGGDRDREGADRQGDPLLE